MSFESIVEECVRDLEELSTSDASGLDGRISPSTLSELLAAFGGGCTDGTATYGGPIGPQADEFSNLISAVKSQPLRKFINRSIIKCGTSEEALQVSRDLCRAVTGNRYCRTSGLFAFVPHLSAIPHVHVWHDCNPKSGMCRCSILLEYRRKQETPFLATRESVRGFRPLRGIPTEEERKEGGTYIQNMFKYVITLKVSYLI